MDSLASIADSSLNTSGNPERGLVIRLSLLGNGKLVSYLALRGPCEALISVDLMIPREEFNFKLDVVKYHSMYPSPNGLAAMARLEGELLVASSRSQALSSWTYNTR
ncbi:hypothetical protein A1F99_042790 [Pyrenophora tritici-repentis]|nr:hypothetical protein A1F99_042790 [Pyrenophora tritici-repentis]